MKRVESDCAADAMKVDYRRILRPRKLQRGSRRRRERAMNIIISRFIRRHLAFRISASEELTGTVTDL